MEIFFRKDRIYIGFWGCVYKFNTQRYGLLYLGCWNVWAKTEHYLSVDVWRNKEYFVWRKCDILDIYLFKKINVYFWERKRDRGWAGEGQRERESQNPKQAPGSELSAQSLTRGSNSQTRDHDLSQSRTLKPRCFVFVFFLLVSFARHFLWDSFMVLHVELDPFIFTVAWFSKEWKTVIYVSRLLLIEFDGLGFFPFSFYC